MKNLDQLICNKDYVSKVAEMAKAGDRNALGLLVELMEPKLLKALKPYILREDVKDEILQELRLELVKSVADFNSELASFGTWFAFRMKGVLRQIFMQKDGRSVTEKSTLLCRRVKRYLSARYSETGNYEIDNEAIGYINEVIAGKVMTKEEIITLLQSESVKTTVESELVEDEGIDTWAIAETISPEVMMMADSVGELVHTLVDNVDVSEKRRRVLKMRFLNGRNFEPTREAVGGVLGVSHQNVRALEMGGLEVLRELVADFEVCIGDYLD